MVEEEEEEEEEESKGGQQAGLYSGCLGSNSDEEKVAA